jgi:hypothetical protein
MSLWSNNTRSKLSLFYLKLKYATNQYLIKRQQQQQQSQRQEQNKFVLFILLISNYLMSSYKKLKRTLMSSFLFRHRPQRNNVSPIVKENNDDEDDNDHKMTNTSYSNETQSQIGIIMWKNFLLFKSNKCALIAECVFSLLFALILMLLINKIDPIERSSTLFKSQEILANSHSTRFNYNNNEKEFYYYPSNNAYVRRILENAVNTYLSPPSSSNLTTTTASKNLEKKRQSKTLLDLFSALIETSNEKIKLIGVNASDAYRTLSYEEKMNMFAFVSFDFANKTTTTTTNDADEIIKYTLHTIE